MTDNTQPEALLPSRETLMAQAQVFASAWAIAGSRFDPGDGMEVAEQEKDILADMTRRLHARITELEAQLEAIGAGVVSGPLMGEQSAPKVSDAQRALHELILNRLSHAELLEKAHYLMELNSNQGRTISELQDLVALTAQAPNQPGCFDAGDMASAAAGGYRDGWTAAQAGGGSAVAGDDAIRRVIGPLLNEFGERQWQSGAGVVHKSLEDAFEAVIEAVESFAKATPTPQAADTGAAQGAGITAGWDGKLSNTLQRYLNALRLECPPDIVSHVEYLVCMECEALHTSLATFKRMYAAARDRYEALEAAAPTADSVLEDAARLTSEQEYAIRQGHEIAASDGYFDTRPQIESKDRRKVFQAGFERGWDAARKQGANHD